MTKELLLFLLQQLQVLKEKNFLHKTEAIGMIVGTLFGLQAPK
jgi:hypothetical protein